VLLTFSVGSQPLCHLTTTPLGFLPLPRKLGKDMSKRQFEPGH
jgi:hypothetical protein